MITCQACGAQLQRIQWTHLRYKCIGKYQNVAEYTNDFPNSPILTADLAIRTSITEENFIKKYGEVEGMRRFRTYCDKQAYSNQFTAKKEKYGWDENTFKKYNKSRAVTYDNLVKRHGLIVGKEKWDNYCERQAYTNSLEYFIEKMGEQDGRAFFDDLTIKKTSHKFVGWSKIEKQFVDDLEVVIGSKLEYTAKTQQIVFQHQSRSIRPDIYHNGRVIEFFGDYWHMNPLFHEHGSVNQTRNRSAGEIWELDAARLGILDSNDVPYMIVWENDYRTKQEDVLVRCKNWILYGAK